MHEMSIAAGLADKLLAFAEKYPERQLVKVRLTVGEMAHIEAEQLRFCYQAITAGMPIEGSELEIEKVAAVVQCAHCSYLGPPKYWNGILAFTSIVTLCCPNCGKTAEAVQGHECAIRSVSYRETVPSAV